MATHYGVIGLMSGTSGDGTDIAHCLLDLEDARWRYEIREAETVPYDADAAGRLARVGAGSAGARELAALHAWLGAYYGRLAAAFLARHRLTVDLVASHGHTLFHDPARGFTFQAGDGACIAAATGVDTVSDFRGGDVALGGQGAPLVPIGDKLLFGRYGCCLNLGGIANISYDDDAGARMAFDICPANMALNMLSNEGGMAFDRGGRLAASGKVNEALLAKLDALPYYKLDPPKSLGREWFDATMAPLLCDPSLPLPDRLRTATEHIARQVARVTVKGQQMLVTGGGAFNEILVGRISALGAADVVVPDEKTVAFKEALVFAFLGVLRKRKEINVLCSVTGASRDSVAGALFSGGP